MNDDDNIDELGFDFNTSATPTESDIGGGGGAIPDGMYHAVVDQVEKDQSGNTPAFKFTFSILAGPHKGRKVFEKLFLSEKANNRVVLFGNRLGLLNQADLGQASVRKSWSDAIGKQVVIEVATREYEAKDGSKKKASNLKFDGLYKLDDPRVAHVQRAGGGPVKAAAAAAAEAVNTFNDL